MAPLPNAEATIAASQGLLSEMMGSLHRSAAFAQLPAAEQQKMRGNLSRVLAYLDQPVGSPAPRPPVAQAMATPTTPGGLRQQVGDTAQRGVKVFGDAVKTVDFPAFVSGLIEGVFTSIVDSSIRQMEAYSKMLEAVVKSVDQFARENFDDDAARQHVQDSFPGLMQLINSPDDNQPMLSFKEGMDGSGFPDFQAMAGSNEPVQLDSRESEAQLLRNAKLEMARSRQQMLATMVLMGINRIVITNGQINAKVTFDVEVDESASASSRVDRSVTDATRDTSKSGWEYNHSGEGKYNSAYKDDKYNSSGEYNSKSSSFVGDVRQRTRTRVSTMNATSQSEGSDSMQLKASLMGEVKLNFKSETFPLERLADGGGLALLQEKAQPKATAAAAPGRGAPAATPVPAAPAPAAPPAAPTAR